MDFEFDAIKRQDKGRGVVCAATWQVLFPIHFRAFTKHLDL
jgi:hypothetical protein